MIKDPLKIALGTILGAIIALGMAILIISVVATF